ncbi:hypothetical protein CEXT_464051, partial [Caerostris extrusa]
MALKVYSTAWFSGGWDLIDRRGLEEGRMILPGLMTCPHFTAGCNSDLLFQRSIDGALWGCT